MSSIQRLGRAARRVQDEPDAGIAMIMAIGTIVFITALIVTATAYAVTGLKQSTKRTTFEQSLAVAENGIDQAMSAIQKQYSTTFTDYPVPGTSGGLGCTMADVSGYQFPAYVGVTQVSDANGAFVATPGRTAEQNERTWARTKLDALRAAGCTKTGPEGEYVVLKPKSPGTSSGKYGKIYALGAVPSFTATEPRVRLIKSEYIFMPYRPQNAILTQGNLEFQGSFLIGQAAGTTGDIASVHSNGSIDITGNAGTVLGAVTATGTVAGSVNASGGITSGTTVQTVPPISATAFYSQAATAGPTVLTTWHDLCSDGTVRPYSASGPCTSATVTASNTFNNWTWVSGTRTWEAGTNIPAGTYFVDKANVTNGNGNGSEPKFTVIASSLNPDNCASKRYGNIDWDHYDLVTTAYPNMWMYADGDVRVTSNIKIGSAVAPIASGGIVAGDQTYLYTQSNSAVGAVVAGDQCKATQPADSLVATNVVHSDLYYDAQADLPLSTIITNTLWLDYSG